jgi:hypothetical protein
LPEKPEQATEHSMRWEDDGGPAVDVENDNAAQGIQVDAPSPKKH